MFRGSLGLAYNSQTGNGVLGMGWSLSGLSAVTRCPRTVAQDGVKGRIAFDADDRFCLDGQRLVAIDGGAYGADGTEYRTERDSFTKVVSYGAAGGGPAWFKVWSRVLNYIPGINAVAGLHDYWMNNVTPFTQLVSIGTMIPAAGITYAALLNGPLSVQLSIKW